MPTLIIRGAAARRLLRVLQPGDGGVRDQG
jgi:hypothetical protein